MAARYDAGSLESYGAVEAGGTDITVPDAYLMFTGDYSREGSDLVLTGSDGGKFVITEYFQTDAPPALLSPEGAMLTSDVVTSLAGSRFPGQYVQASSAPAQGAKAIGSVQTQTGGATVIRADGTTETLSVGDSVYQGDVVQTGPGAKLGISFVDGTVFSMSANARMVLDSLIYNPGGSDNSMLFSLVEGAFVFTAGAIAPTGNMNIKTPVATMGIRGTTPTVDINSITGQVNFSLIPDPRDGHEGSYVLKNLATNEIMGSITGTASKWELTSADGTVTEIPKNEDDLLSDQDAIKEIGIVYNTAQSNNQQQQGDPNDTTQSIPNTPPDSSGLNTTPNNNNPDNNTPPQGPPVPGPTEDDPPPAETAPGPTTDNDPLPITDPTGGTGINFIFGTEFNDNGGDGEDDRPELLGTDGNDVIFGNAGNDIITAFAGDDIVDAGAGDDTIIAGTGEGDDDYDGGDDTDTISYASTSQGVEINLVEGTVIGPEIGSDTIVNIERYIGGDGDDTIIVDEDSGWAFNGGAGIDTVRIEGDLDINTATMKSDALNVEIVDMNNSEGENIVANTFTISVDDFIDPENDTGMLQIRGDEHDTVVLTNTQPADEESGFSGGFYEGCWHKAGTTTLDGVDYNIYLFMQDGVPIPVGVAAIEVGVDVQTTRLETVRDEFNTVAYDGNDGTQDWKDDWDEENDDFNGAENGEPDQGEIFVSGEEGQLQLTLTDNDSEGDEADTVHRSADLTGATAAILTFEFRRVDMETNDEFQILASSDGVTFKEIGTITGTGIDDQGFLTATFDLTPYISDNTTIKFAADDFIDNGDTLFIDNVQITYDQVDGAPEQLDIGPEGLFNEVVFGTNEVDQGLQAQVSGNNLFLGFNGGEFISSSDSGQTILGGGGDDSIVVLNGDNYLLGGPGNDDLISGNGSDFLDGGDGDDTLTLLGDGNIAIGGSGSDVFNIQTDGGELLHQVLDFTVDVDSLDLSSLLDGVFDPLNDDINDFVKAETSFNPRTEEARTTISIDPDGPGEAFGFDEIAVLNGVGIDANIAVTIGDDDHIVTSTAAPLPA